MPARASVVIILLQISAKVLIVATEQRFQQALSSPLEAAFYTAVLAAEPSQGLGLSIRPSACDLQYLVSSPQYAVYLGTSEEGTGVVKQTKYCASARICTGSFPGAPSPQTLVVASTVFIDAEVPSFQVAIQLAGETCLLPASQFRSLTHTSLIGQAPPVAKHLGSQLHDHALLKLDDDMVLSCQEALTAPSGSLPSPVDLAKLEKVHTRSSSFFGFLRPSDHAGCAQTDLPAPSVQYSEPGLHHQLQDAGRAAEAAADPRKAAQDQPPEAYPLQSPGSSSLLESSQLLTDINVWAPKVTLTTFPNGRVCQWHLDPGRGGMLYTYALPIIKTAKVRSICF